MSEKEEEFMCVKVAADYPMQEWVTEAYQAGVAINKVKITFDSLLQRMRTMEIYRFLALLEIYGSSPNIDILNEYIVDEKIL